jgi:cytochrome c oxidase subunit 3
MSLRQLETAPAPAAGHHHGAIQTLSHQFEDIDQQNECYIVGMWTFLVTEIMFFGALFCAYSVYRVLYFSTYMDAHRFLDIKWGFINTLVLLTSSLMMALGVHAAQMGRRKILINWLFGVLVCSAIFLGIKGIEYKSKFDERLFPGPSFNFAYAKQEWAKHHGAGHGGGGEAAGGGGHAAAGAPAAGGGHGGGIDDIEGYARNYNERAAYNARPEVGFNTAIVDVNGSGIAQAMTSPENLAARAQGNRAQLFFSLYFAMTGLHAIHIIIGMILMATLAYLAWKDHPSVRDYMPTEMIGFYWHFVDIVWIFLFPLMYLIS